MKRRYFFMAAVFITAVCVWDNFHHVNQETTKKERGNSPLSLSPEVPVVTETKMTISPAVAETSIPELEEAREMFGKKLKALKEMTRDYNRKAIQKQLTSEDEEAYRKMVEESKKALRIYELAVIKSSDKKEMQ